MAVFLVQVQARPKSNGYLATDPHERIARSYYDILPYNLPSRGQDAQSITRGEG